jgi:hypothetical protein
MLRGRRDFRIPTPSGFRGRPAGGTAGHFGGNPRCGRLAAGQTATGVSQTRPAAARPFSRYSSAVPAVPHSTPLARKAMSPAARAACAVVFTLSSAGAALAQAAAESPSHSQPAAGVSYQSTLEEYQRFTEEKLISWQEANDTVGRIGGWRTYAREAQQPAGSTPAAPRAPVGTDAKPAPRDPRAGHGHH